MLCWEAVRARSIGYVGVAVLTAACTFGQNKAGGQGGDPADPETTSTSDDGDDDESTGDGIPNPTASGTEGPNDTGEGTGGCVVPAALDCPCEGDDDCIDGLFCADDVCIASSCGNGIVEGDEGCDDGDRVDDDGCDIDCQPSTGIAQMVGGAEHTCARTHEGEVKCWGEGASGRLGLGNMDDVGASNTPAEMRPVDVGGVVVDICAGADFTCVALEDGDARCWGDAAQGKLGTANNQDIGDDEPPSMPDPIEIGGTAIGVACGSLHACVLLSGGAVRCWGVSNSGRLGNMVNESIGDDEHPNEIDPVVVGGAVADVVAGAEHTCALLEDGSVRCWGNAALGRLGNGNAMENIGDDEPPSVATNIVALGAPAVQITAGDAHTCALLDDGSIKCWGEATNGQLGNGDDMEDLGDDETLDTVDPVPLPAAIAIGAGGDHSCAVLTSGDVTCWGEAGFGQLGNESTIDVVTPTGLAVNLGQDVDVVSVGAGAGHTCARIEGGALICFGLNTRGQLGYGEGTDPVGDDEPPAFAGAVPF